MDGAESRPHDRGSLDASAGGKRTGWRARLGSAPAWLWGLPILAIVIVAGLLVWVPGISKAVRALAGLSPTCGNGRLDSGEDCDDGNQREDDGCRNSCHFAACGDGVRRAHVEECDDGNRVDGDGCSSACITCPVGPDSFSSPQNGHCYWRIDVPRSWKDAAADCANGGAHLAMFGDDLEWREVTEHLLTGEDATSSWIGMRDEDRNGVRDFGWVSGERIFSAHWAIHEPRPLPGDAACGAEGAGGTWTAHSCDEKRPYICEHPTWAIAPRSSHAYRRFMERLSFPQASSICEKNGGHLVTFENVNEQAFVSDLFQGTIWIGVQLDEKTRHFGPITGEPLHYADFAPGEPNNVDQEKCVALDVDRRWYNRDCSDRHGFVCEVD